MTTTAKDNGSASVLDVARGLVPLIREHADRGEHERRLPAPVAEAFTKAGMFRLCRPKELGGWETDPLTLYTVIEELARADGSAGWCALISGAGALFEGFIPQDVAREMFSDPDSSSTGVMAPTGRAVEVDGGYRVTGRWAMASNCQNCNWLGGGALIFDGDVPRPEPVITYFPATDCRILDTWKVSGLAGTGSNDIEVTDLFVPHGRGFRLSQLAPQYMRPLFMFPFFALLSNAIASATLGVARSAIDELTRLASSKTPHGMASKLANRPTAQIAVAKAEGLLRSSRALVFEASQQAWDAACQGRPASLKERGLLRLAATHATACCARP